MSGTVDLLGPSQCLETQTEMSPVWPVNIHLISLTTMDRIVPYPSNPYTEAPTSNMIVFEDGDFGR